MLVPREILNPNLHPTGGDGYCEQVIAHDFINIKYLGRKGKGYFKRERERQRERERDMHELKIGGAKRFITKI